MPNLRVSARSVVFRYKGQANVDAQQVGQTLGVTAVVTGRVAVRGDRLVIQTELMNVDTGTQLWGGQYNRPQTDLLAVQEEIAEEILDKAAATDQRRGAAARHAALHGERRGVPALPPGPLSLEQRHDRGLQARHRLLPAGDQQGPEVRHGVRRTCRLVPAARIVLGRDASRRPRRRPNRRSPSTRPLAEAHVALGQHQAAARLGLAGRRARVQAGASSLNPSSALAHNQYANYLATLGRLTDALSRGPPRPGTGPALADRQQRPRAGTCSTPDRIDEAIAQFRKTLEFDPNSVSAHRGLGLAYSENDQHIEAIAELKRALDALGEQPGHPRRPRRRVRPCRTTAPTADGVLKQLTAMAARSTCRRPPSRSSTRRSATSPAPSTRSRRPRRTRLRDHADHGRALVQTLRDEPRFATGREAGLRSTTGSVVNSTYWRFRSSQAYVGSEPDPVVTQLDIPAGRASARRS